MIKCICKYFRDLLIGVPFPYYEIQISMLLNIEEQNIQLAEMLVVEFVVKACKYTYIAQSIDKRIEVLIL